MPHTCSQISFLSDGMKERKSLLASPRNAATGMWLQRTAVWTAALQMLLQGASVRIAGTAQQHVDCDIQWGFESYVITRAKARTGQPGRRR